MVTALLAVGCIAVGLFWVSRPERIVDALRSQGQLKESRSRELQVRVSRWFGWFGIVFSVLWIVYSATQI